MNITQLVIQFLISGFVVVGATIISKSFDSKWAGLLVALPVMTILGLIFISSNTNEIVTQRYLLSALIFMIPAAVYLFSIYFLFGKFSLLINCIISFIPFAISVFVLQMFF
jgi:uncharacterized membrane protein (GlpM family)